MSITFAREKMTDHKQKWCCSWLRDSFERRYERGFFVFCEPECDVLDCGPTYWLGMRSVRVEDQERFSHERMAPADGKRPVELTLCTWRPIKFCPGCGHNLHRFYKKSFGILTDDVLSKEHPWNGEQQNPELSSAAAASDEA